VTRQIISQLKTVRLGDLCLVEWHDASIGKSLRGGGAQSIDVPVSSFGVFIGLLGEHRKHIVLAQNNFRYASGLYDIDYTAIPVPWACKISVLVKGQVEAETARQLLQSFLISGGRARIAKSCGRQQRLHGYG
jgi:hypothetical protein